MRPGIEPRGPSRVGGRRRSSGGGSSAIRAAKRTFWAIGIAVVLIVTGIVVWVFAGQSTKPATAAHPTHSDSEIFRAAGDPPAQDTPPPSTKQMLKMAKTFVEATQPSDLPGLVHLNGKKPEELFERMVAMAKADGSVAKIIDLGAMPNLTLPLQGVVVTYGEQRNRLILFCPDAEGQWLIDFDAFARASSIPWKELLSDQDRTGTVRVYLSQDTYYNSRFSDDSQWACYGMKSPDEPTLVFGYTPKNSPVDQAITEALRFKLSTATSVGSSLLRMTLEIRHVPGDETRQFEIVRAIADDWATPTRPLDAHYH